MSETNNKLEIKNLSKRFGEKIFFENLSLTVDDPAGAGRQAAGARRPCSAS